MRDRELTSPRRWLLVLPALLGLCVPLAEWRANSNAADLAKSSAQDELPFQVPPGFVAELVAAPPLVQHPMFACFDDRGRLYVADSAGINPTGEELSKNPPHRIVLLEDTQGNGHFDKSTVFADRLTYPQGVLWHDGAVFTCSPPSLWRLEDTDGDGVADNRQQLVTGWVLTGVADELHGPTLGPDGRLYWGCGRFNHEIKEPGGPVLRKGRAPLILRCRPDGKDVEVLSGAQGNPVKAAFTPEGEPLVCGTWAGTERNRQDVIIHCVEGGDYPVLDGDFQEHKKTGDLLPPLTQLGVAAAAGAMRYRGHAFGDAYRDNLFSALYNMHKIERHLVERAGATFRCRDEDFVVSSRADFHPTDVLEDADGSILVVNTGSWFSHCPTSRLGQSPVKGSIYRIRRQGAATMADPRGLSLKWDSLRCRELTGLLDDPRFAVRDRAIQQLARQGRAALDVLQEVLRSGVSARARRNALWAVTRIDGPEARAAVRFALADKDPSVRLTAATSVGLHRDAVAQPRLQELVTSDLPPIRRQAATALGRLRQPAAVPALLEALRTGTDRFLDHALIYALIVIADWDATRKGLHDPSPLVRRGSLIALDQMAGSKLTPDLVTPLLDPSEPVVQQATLNVIANHPGWAREMIDLLRQWLAREEPDGKRQENLRNQLLAFCPDSAIQDLIALRLRQDRTPVATRLLLLEVMARAALEKLPPTWVAELRWGLEHRDERVVHSAVGALRSAGVAEVDEPLLRLARDPARSEDLRVEALAAVGPRLSPEAADFAFLLKCLDQEQSPLLRLNAAAAMGQAQLSDEQLAVLTQAMARAGALEISRLLAAYERSENQDVGQKLVAALGQSPGLQNLTPDALRRTLKRYPAVVQKQACPLLTRLETDNEKQAARLAQLEPQLQTGDPVRGHEVFFGKRAACTACHAVQSQGAHIGPDLSRIGAIRSRRDLLEAIVFPSASFARGYEPYVIAGRDGRLYTGIIGRETADAIFLINTERAEIRLPRSSIERIERGRVSIMPQGLDEQLSRQELADVIAFLQSLR